MLPIFGNENLEHGMGPKALPRRAGKADGIFREIIGHQFGTAGLGDGEGGEGEISLGGICALPECDPVLRFAHKFVFAREEIGEPHPVIERAGPRDQGFCRRFVTRGDFE